MILSNYSKSSNNSKQNFNSETSNSNDKRDSQTDKSHTCNLQYDLSAPAIDLPISRKSVSVMDLAVLSAAEFADAQYNDFDLVRLQK